MVPRVFCMAPCLAMLYVVSVLHETMQRYVAASIPSFAMELLPLPIFICRTHFTGSRVDPARIMWAHCLNDGHAFAVCTALLVRCRLMHSEAWSERA